MLFPSVATLRVSYFFRSSSESWKDFKMSSVASPIEYMRVWTWTASSLPVKPDAYLKRSNRRAHLGQSSG